MNPRIVWAIARKDLIEVRANRMAWLPALIVPLIFVVVMPLLVLLLPSFLPPEASRPQPRFIEQVLKVLPGELAATVRLVPPAQQVGLIVTGHLFAPMFLIIPLMLATIVGANAFVGERERKTLEALLYTPASDAEIFLGKTVASLIPAVAISWGSFAIYAVVLNAVVWPLLGRPWFPTAPWWPLMLWVGPAMAALGMTVTVLVSARASTFMEANQTAGMPVLLVLGLLATQATGVLSLTVGVAFLIGAAIWLVDGLLLWFAIRTFSRSQLLTRL